MGWEDAPLATDTASPAPAPTPAWMQAPVVSAQTKPTAILNAGRAEKSLGRQALEAVEAGVHANPLFALTPRLLNPGEEAQPVRAAEGPVEAIQAGFQGSATGLAWRNKLPELVVDPQNSKWWERALSTTTQVASELPQMIVGSIGGGAAGAAAGTAVAPGPGTVAGGVLGAGGGMNAVPAMMRTALMEAYKSGDIDTVGEFFDVFKNILKQTAIEGGIGTLTMGTGGIAARGVGKVIAPQIGQAISVPVAKGAIAAADISAQIGTMTMVPAAIQGELPNAQDFLDSAIVVGGMAAAGKAGSRMMDTFERTGKKPAEIVADAQTDPSIKADLMRDEAPIGFETPVGETIQRNLEAVGMPDVEAATNAKLWDSYFNSMAERTGLAPDVLLDRYFGGITKGDVAGAESLTQAKETWATLDQTLAGDNLSAARGVIDKLKSGDMNQANAIQYLQQLATREGVTPEARRAMLDAAKLVPQAKSIDQLFQPAYHGSPHDFDKFSLEKIGTGEGAQAYGHGLYFAENPEVAKEYQQKLQTTDTLLDGKKVWPADPNFEAVVRIAAQGYKDALAIARRDSSAEFLTPEGRTHAAKIAKEIEALKDAKIENKPSGSIYQVDIPDQHVANFLDWDKPLSEQPSSVRKALEQDAAQALGTDAYGTPQTIQQKDPNGLVSAGAFYHGLAQRLGSDKAASEYLNSLGIKGIKYLDAGSRTGDKETRNLVVFDDSIVKITHKDGTPVTAEERQQLFQKDQPPSGPTFYSELARQVDSIKMGAAPAKGWQDTIKGLVANGKVKQAEIEATGLNDFLDLQEGKVTKEQVQEFLQGNGVKVEEVTLGEQSAEFRKASDEYRAAVKADAPEEELLRLEAAKAALRNGGAPKFASYQLPGGENYKELLLTLPPTEVKVEQWKAIRADGHVDSTWSTEEQARAQAQKIGGVVRSGGATALAGGFRSSHYDQPNILAHVRFNERTDAEGKKVLFLEELQSDWAQKGRKEGFGKEYFRVVNKGTQNLAFASGDNLATRAEAEAAISADRENFPGAYRGQLEIISSPLREGVPSAPFVGKTEAWTALALKRMIRYAAENGFDRVAWTTGEQQAARYDLSKQVKSIEYVKRGDKYELALELHNGEGHNPGTFTAKELEDQVGKEVAQKIIDGEGKTYRGHEGKTLEGLDLKVGGEGMKGYYDKIVPGVAKDILKKLGGGKVHLIELGAPTTAKTLKGEEGFQSVNSGFDITPELRDKVMAGQPLFQRGGDGFDQNGKARGFTEFGPGGKMTIGLLQSADRSTFLHESGHFFLEVTNDLAHGPQGTPQLKADMQAVFDWLGVKSWDDWKAMSLDQKRPYHEQFARGFESYLREGRAPSAGLAKVFGMMRDWLVQIYRSAAQLRVNVSPEVKNVMARMLATDQEIAAGVPRTYAQEAVASRAQMIVPGDKAKEVAASPFAEALPQAKGEPAVPTHINYNYIDTPEDVNLAMARLSEVYEAEIQNQRRGTVSWDQTSAEAAQIIKDNLGGQDMRLIMPREPGTAAGAAELLARKQMVLGAAEDMMRARDKLLEKGADASPEEQLAFLAAIERTSMIQSEFLGARAEAGRALNILKNTARDAERIRLIQQVIDQYGGDPQKMAKMLKEIDSPAGALKAARELAKASTWDKIVEGWKAGILSGPITQLRNIIGNSSGLLTRPLVDAAAVPFGILRGSEAERVRAVEPLARVIGQVQAIHDASKLAVASFSLADAAKAEQPRQAITGPLAIPVQAVFRSLGAADLFFRTLYERGEAYALGARQAAKEGLNPSSDAFKTRMLELVQNPTKDMQDAITESGDRGTFNKPFEPGGSGRAATNLVRKMHMEFLFPFIRTPTRVLEETFRLSPFAPMIPAWRADFKAGGVRRDRAMGELVTGGALMGGFFVASLNGIITGSGDPDPRKREIAQAAGFQAYSFKFGDTYYNYQGLGPLATLIGMAADMVQVWDHMSDEERDKIPKIIAVAFANAVTNQTALMGMTNLVNITSDPTRYAPKFFDSFAGSIVPALIAQPTAIYDDYARQVNGMLDQIKSRIPGLRQTLMPKVDVFGKEIESNERALIASPITETTESKDPVRTEAARLNVSAPGLPNKLHLGRGSGKLGDIEITPEQRDAYRRASGEMVDSMMRGMVESPSWAQMPDIVKRKAYQKAFAIGARVGAMAALPPDMREGAINEITQKMEQQFSIVTPTSSELETVGM